MFKRIFSLSVFYLFSLACFAQINADTIFQVLTFSSKIFNNTRSLRVLLPPGYNDEVNKNKKYPVLYLNDGFAVFNHGMLKKQFMIL